ncbi:MAG: hypothetical protein AAFX99_27220, partial [Myxococcota bacterium]
AADARCSTIPIQDNAPSDLELINPPESVTLRPERGQPTFSSLNIRLDDGQSQVIRINTMAFALVIVNNANPTAEVIFDRIRIEGSDNFIAPMGLTGYGITVRNSEFLNNQATSGFNNSGAINFNFAFDFALERNIFRNNRVAHNEVSPTQIAGAVIILDGQSSNGRIVGNLFDGNGANASDGAGAIFIDSGIGNVTVRNNTFVHNTNLLNMQASTIACAGDLPGGLLSSNIIWFATGRHVFGCAQAPIVYSNHDNGVPSGEGNLSVDPLFTDPDNGDYTLSSTSPGIDSGDPDPAQNDPDGSRNDMGYTGGPLP